MKRNELFDLYNKLQGLKYHSDKKMFSYALIKNIKMIESEISEVNGIIKPNDDFLQFEKERISICRLYSIKDENGEPILNGEEFQIENMEEFSQKLIPMKEQYKDTLVRRQEQIDKYNSKLDEEIVMELVKVGPEDLPDAISPNEIEDMYPILL